MPFDPNAYLKDNTIEGIAKKGGFDPSSYLKANEMPEAPKGSPLEAFVQSAGKELTLGYLPQLQAMGAKAVDYAFDVPNAPGYAQLRDESIKRGEQLSKDFPMSSGAGTVAGVLGGGAALSGIAPGVTVADRIRKSALIGAALGGASNPGDTEGEIDPFQVNQRASNAATGAALGGVTQGALEAISPLSKYISKYFQGAANEKAVKALGGTAKQKAKLQDMGLEQKLGAQLLEEGVIPKLGTPGRILNRIESAKDKAGKAIGEIVDSAGNAPIIDTKAIAADLAANSDIAVLRGIPGAEGLANTSDQILSTLGSRGVLSLKDTQGLRRQIDKQINYAGNLDKGKQSVLKLIRDRLAQSMDQAADQYGIGGLKQANQTFSNLSRAEEMVKNKLGREAANRSVSLTDTIAAGAGIASGGTPGASALLGAALGGLNKAGRTFGSSLSARTNQGLAGLAGGVGGLTGNLANLPGPVALITNRITQRSPFKKIEDDPVLKDKATVDFFRANPSVIDQLKDERLKAGLRKVIKGK